MGLDWGDMTVLKDERYSMFQKIRDLSSEQLMMIGSALLGWISRHTAAVWPWRTPLLRPIIVSKSLTVPSLPPEAIKSFAVRRRQFEPPLWDFGIASLFSWVRRLVILMDSSPEAVIA